ELEEIAFFVKKEDIKIDLKGRLVLPGFTDCHTHFTEYAINKYNKYRIEIDDNNSFNEVLERVRKKSSEIPSGEWITGWGWNKNKWPSGEIPHKDYLDKCTERNPVALDSKDGHCLWCNTLALKIAGIEHITGILYENEIGSVKKAIKKPSPEQYRESVKEAIKEAHRAGLTGIHICEGSFEFNVYQELYRDGLLPFRVTWHFPLDLLDNMIDLRIASGFGSDYLKIGCVKIFTDGSLGSRTASMFEPYEGMSHCGTQIMTEEELVHIINKANRNGISCAVHAIGDRANHIVLNAFEHAGNYGRRQHIKNRIEHAQLLKPEDICRFSENNIIASVQPVHIINDIPLAEKYWGTRSRYAYPFSSLLKKNTHLIFGSDVPVEKFNPFSNIYAATNRKYLNKREEKSWHIEECINIEEAIKAYTSEPAMASGDEKKGSLSPGKLADLIVIDRDIFTCEDILNTSVHMTVVAGNIVYNRDASRVTRHA
ncbi:MAG: amidohydrolase, partial [Candidatus Eremiobacterota bacterium]